MKSTKNLILLLFLPILFIKCEKTDDGSYVDPLTIYEKMAGTWNLTSILLIDEIAKANSITPNEVELKAKFGFSDFAITFNVDADSLPTTFEVNSTAPELFLSSGYWDLDSPFVHSDGTSTEIFLYSDAEKTQMVDRLSITAIPGTRSELEFKLIRQSEGTPYASYLYNFRLDQ
jgi:hypothetical protein